MANHPCVGPSLRGLALLAAAFLMVVGTASGAPEAPPLPSPEPPHDLLGPSTSGHQEVCVHVEPPGWQAFHFCVRPPH